MNFRSPSSKVANFQFQSGEVRRLSRNFRGSYAKHSRKSGWKLRSACPDSFKTPRSWFLLAGGCFCSGVFLRRPSGCAFSDQLYSAGILRALPVDTHGSSLQLPVGKPHKTFAEKKTFATPFAELSRRSTLRPKGRPLHSSIQRPFGRLSYTKWHVCFSRQRLNTCH